MPGNIHINKIREVLDLIVERLASIGKLNKEAPKLEQAKEELEWMLESEQAAPEITFVHPSEDVLENLNSLGIYLSDHRIPGPPSSGTAVISTASISSSSDYANHVSSIGQTFVGVPEVITWQSDVLSGYGILRDRQNRSDKTNKRLEQLDGRLSELHNNAKSSCFSVSAEVVSPIESAELLRELLNGFKGSLIRRCQLGRGTKYGRIADNLAVDTQTTHDAICDQQTTYDRLHSDLSEIAKSRKEIKGFEIKSYLEDLEDHVLIVTSAIDPLMIGFEFCD